MKIFYVKLIFTCEGSISYVKNMFNTPTFERWNFEPVHFTRKSGISYVNGFQFGMVMKISYVKMFQFHTFFTCEITSEIFYGRDNRFPHCPSAGKHGHRFVVLTTIRKEKDIFCFHV